MGRCADIEAYGVGHDLDVVLCFRRQHILSHAGDKLRYTKEVESWNKTHPDDLLVLDANGVAVRQRTVDKELKEKQEKKKAKKAEDKASRCIT